MRIVARDLAASGAGDWSPAQANAWMLSVNGAVVGAAQKAVWLWAILRLVPKPGDQLYGADPAPA